MLTPTRPRALPARIMRRMVSIPAEAALRTMNVPPVERHLAGSYERERKEHAERLPPVPSEDAHIIRGLAEKGVHLTSLRNLAIPGTDEMFAQAARLSDDLTGRPKNPDTPTVSASADDLMRHPALFAWGVSERLLRIAQSYLGLPVAYDGLTFFQSLPTDYESGDRYWHLDREDRRMVKIAIYVTDVAEADGPLQVAPHELNARIEAKPFHYRPFPQNQMENRLGEDSRLLQSLTGAAGTVVFVDTARLFHRGTPPVARPRTAIYHSYFSRKPRHPFFCERSPLSRTQIETLSQDMNPEQRSCALWWHEQPVPLRWLPRSRL